MSGAVLPLDPACKTPRSWIGDFLGAKVYDPPGRYLNAEIAERCGKPPDATGHLALQFMGSQVNDLAGIIVGHKVLVANLAEHNVGRFRPMRGRDDRYFAR